jgi:hypothetical protein
MKYNLILIILLIAYILADCGRKDSIPGNRVNVVKGDSTIDKISKVDYNTISICRDLSIGTTIKSWEKISDSITYVDSELWSEYDDNKILGRRPFPDEFFVHTFVLDGGFFLGGRSKDISPFKMRVTAQLKYGINDGCAQPFNAQVTPEKELNKVGKIEEKDFMNMMVGNSTKPIEFKSSPFKLKEELEKYNINGRDFFLNQIIIRTYIETIDGHSSCVGEYIHPVCTKLYQYQ